MQYRDIARLPVRQMLQIIFQGAHRVSQSMVFYRLGDLPLRETPDIFLYGCQQLFGRIQRGHVQTALDLGQQAQYLRHLVALGRIAEKGVQTLFDTLQVRQHLMGQRNHCIALLHLAVQIDQIQHPLCIFGLHLDSGLHALGQDARLLLKTTAKMVVIIDAAVQQQQRHRHLHGDGPRMIRHGRILR